MTLRGGSLYVRHQQNRIGAILANFIDLGAIFDRCWCHFSQLSSIWGPFRVDFGTGGHHINQSQIFTRLLTLDGVPNGVLLAKMRAQVPPESRPRGQDACFGGLRGGQGGQGSL